MSLIANFIYSNSNWETLLTDAPYYLRIKRDEQLPGLVLFKYREGKSNFRNPIVREARGIILDESDNFKIVCRSFDKFFANDETDDLRSIVGESTNPELDIVDWHSAYGVQKIDGSLIRLYFWKNEWHASTKGVIDAHNAPIAGMKFTFGDLLDQLLDLSNIPIELNTEETHMFELTSQHAIINVVYSDTGLAYIISRDNANGDYIFNKDATDLPLNYGQVTTPKICKLQSMEDALNIVSNSDFNSLDNEGIVVYDDRGPRMKVKTPLYTAIKHIRKHLTRRNGNANYLGMASLILQDPNIVEYIESKYKSRWATKYFPLLHDLRDNIDTYLSEAKHELEEFNNYLSKKNWRDDQIRRYIKHNITDKKLGHAYLEDPGINLNEFYQQQGSLGWLVHMLRPHLSEQDPGPAPKINYPK